MNTEPLTEANEVNDVASALCAGSASVSSVSFCATQGNLWL